MRSVNDRLFVALLHHQRRCSPCMDRTKRTSWQSDAVNERQDCSLPCYINYEMFHCMDAPHAEEKRMHELAVRRRMSARLFAALLHHDEMFHCMRCTGCMKRMHELAVRRSE
jgi:hypothetical protein